LLVGLAVLGWVQRARYGLDDLIGPDQLAASQWFDEGGPRSVPLLRQGLAHSDARIRARCLVSLDRLGERDTLPAVMTCLRDPDLNVRAVAARTLLRQRAWPSPEPLLACLRQPGQDPRVRTYLLDALSRAQVPEVVPDLIKSAGNRETTLSERMMGVQGLLRMRVAQAKPTLLSILNDATEHPRLRLRAGMALGRSHEYGVLMEFLGRRGQDDQALAGACAGLLGAPPEVIASMRPALMKLSTTPTTPARARVLATRVLLEYGVTVPDRFLADLLLHHEEREVRRLAAEAIPYSRDEQVWDSLFDAQDQERSGDVRRAIACSISKLP